MGGGGGGGGGLITGILRYRGYTWLPEDMKFLFSCSTRYSTSERSERVRYILDMHEVFAHFPKISEHFQNVVRWSYECFRTFSELFRKFPKIP